MILIGKYTEKDLLEKKDKEDIKNLNNEDIKYYHTVIKKDYLMIYGLTTEEYLNSNIL